MELRSITKVKDPTRIAAFTEHRDFPWGRDTECSAHKGLQYQMEQCIYHALRRKVNTFLCGMALGADTLFAQSVLRAKQSTQKVYLVAAVPSPTQASKWAVPDQITYRNLIAQCDALYTADSSNTMKFAAACIQRNEWMVDNSSLLLSYYDGRKSGGTAYTVRYAHRQKREVISLLAS